MAIWDDARVRAGMARQLAQRRALLDDGAGHLGWKVGLATPAAMAAVGTDGPLVGFLTVRNTLAPGDEAAIGAWGALVAEAEIAVRLGTDLPAGRTPTQAAAAVDAVAPAIELADTAGDRSDVEAVVAGNIFHRHVLLGPWDAARAGLDVHGVRLDFRGRAVYAEQVDPRIGVGDLADVVRHVADVLDAFGERLRAGDVIITGAIVPPQPVVPGEVLDVRLSGLGELRLVLR
jgi:2-keto-4-pentenoate hydratase